MKFEDDFEESNSKVNDEIQSCTFSCDTLNDTMSSAPLIEDVSIFCDECKDFIYYGEIQMHRKLHKSLILLQINDFNGITFKNLVNRRNKIIKHLKTCSQEERENILSKVDEAYTVVYNYLITETHQEIQFNRLVPKENLPYKYGSTNNIFSHIRTGSLFSEIASTFNIAFGINSQLKDNEPSIIAEKISDINDCFAIITGIDGNCAKKFVSENLLLCLIENLDNERPNDSKSLSKAVHNTLFHLDKSLRTGLHDDVTFKSWSGCCLEMVVLTKLLDGSFELTVTNVGDGTVILVTEDEHQLLSTLHSMKNENEVKRIENLGGTGLVINGESFLCGTTQTTQLLGGYGNNARKQYQQPTLHCYTLKIKPEKDLGVVILNREVSRLIPVEDVVEIFRSEIIGTYSTLLEPNNDIYNELIDNEDNLNLAIKNLQNTCQDTKHLGNLENKSQIIARKVINAGALSSNHTCNLGVIVLLLNENDHMK